MNPKAEINEFNTQDSLSAAKKTSGRARRSFAMRAAIARPVRRRCALILRRDERADRGEQW